MTALIYICKMSEKYQNAIKNECNFLSVSIIRGIYNILWNFDNIIRLNSDNIININHEK